MKRILGNFKNGLVTQNPTFRLVLGMCPTLAITTSVMNGLGMGLATTFVLVFSNLFISMMRKVIPDKIRIPAFIVFIATFVTIVEMVMNKFTYDLYEQLGVFIALITVNCIVFARAEAFASANPVLDSAVDGLAMGLGFTIALCMMGLVRELLAFGTAFGFTVLGDWFPKIGIFARPAGGFMTLALLMAAFNAVYNKVEKARKARQKGEEEEAIEAEAAA